MKTNFENLHRGLLAVFMGLVLVGCDQLQNVATGVGSDSSANAAKVTDSRASGGGGETGADTTGQEDEPAEVAQAEPTKVRLNAFTDWKCSDNWTNRDGGWGLKAGTGSGVCTADFPGYTAEYRVVLMAQLEFDGSPKYRISVDGETVAAGAYPVSKGELICDCPNWRVNCPDRIVPIDGGVHKINNGSKLEFVGEEVYPCGGNHGAYVKWHEVVFIPAD